MQTLGGAAPVRLSQGSGVEAGAPPHSKSTQTVLTCATGCFEVESGPGRGVGTALTQAGTF